MSKGKILIVEDDMQISKALAIRLRASGFEIASAADGTGGVRALVKEKPDLVLLDISMPGGGGFFVAESLNRRPEMMATTPVVFITASKAPDVREKAESFGPAAFVEKPFKSEELVAVIEAVLAGADVTGLVETFQERGRATTSAL